ncbi:MAG: alpha/beta fold hydrolase [Candidatus Zixiibacteriota bacterium]|nr:MAG: alpha/beta fold hydrolase [candidate division Zixibacteria bacterium]
MSEVESGYIEVTGGQLFYEKTGRGEPIVLIHDGLIHHEVWNHQIESWADRYTLIRYDRRGYGKSPAPTEEFSNGDDLLAVFDTLGIDSAMLVGMSAGGGLAIDFALEHQNRVTRLILVGAVVSGMPYTDHFLSRGGRLTAGIYSDPDSLLNYLIDSDPYEIYQENTEARAEARALLERYPNNLDAAFSQLARPPRRSAVAALGEIDVPTQVIVGEYDIPDVHAHAGAISTGIPGAERIVLKNSGHLVPLEQPAAFNEAVMTFLSGTEFFHVLRQSGVPEAVALFHEKRERTPDAVLFSEARLNQLGYQYLLSGNTESALQLFKINVETYPGSANVYDSYAEALLKSGDTSGAIVNYEKSLELNPKNANATAVLERLRGKQ